MALDDQRMEVVSHSKAFNVQQDRFLRAITQMIILSISLFCIIFFHSSSSSSRFYFLVRSLNLYLSAIPLHSLDKRWVFLICNGILAIVANTSGLVNFPFLSSPSRSSGFDHNHSDSTFGFEDYNYLHIARSPAQVLLLENAYQQAKKYEGPNGEEDGQSHLQEAEEEKEEVSEEEFEDKLSITGEEEEEEGHEKQIMEVAAVELQGEEIRIDITGGDQENDNNFDCDDRFDHPLREENEQEEGIVLERMSTEELNKKFEDFIGKMKEELRIEAQQHHLVVVK